MSFKFSPLHRILSMIFPLHDEESFERTHSKNSKLEGIPEEQKMSYFLQAHNGAVVELKQEDPCNLWIPETTSPCSPDICFNGIKITSTTTHSINRLCGNLN